MTDENGASLPCLILNWAPQKLILCHEATSVFVSHCGWNSTMESLVGGVPVAAWPVVSDGKMNALSLAQIGTGVLIEGTETKSARNITADHIEQAIRLVSTEPFKTSSQMWKNKIREALDPGGSSEQDFTLLVEAIGSLQK